MQITIDNDADGHGNPQIDLVLTDGTRLTLTEQDSEYLRIRKVGNADHGGAGKDTIVVSPVCSNVVEVG